MSASLTSTGITMPTGGTLGDASSAAPLYAARAWVSFAAPGTISGQGNVSSMTKNGGGDYTANFTTAMPDANYSVVYVDRPSTGAVIDVCNISSVAGPGTGGVRVFAGQASNGSGREPVLGCIVVFR